MDVHRNSKAKSGWSVDPTWEASLPGAFCGANKRQMCLWTKSD